MSGSAMEPAGMAGLQPSRPARLHLHHEYFLNPDGSARVHVRWTGPGGPNAPTPEQLVRSELAQARGVAAWAEVDCRPEADELVFHAVAWVPEIAALRFHCQGLHIGLLDFVVEPCDDGSVVIATKRSAPTGTGRPLPADADAVTVAAALAGERERIAPAREFLAELFGDLACTVIVHAPGELVGPTPGRRLDARTVQVEFAGADLLAVIDRLLTDDAALRTLLEAGEVTPEVAFAQLGAAGPIQLRTAPNAEPLFDYLDEVQAAQAAFAPFAAELELTTAPTSSEPIDAVRVVAARIVREVDVERELCPAGSQAACVSWTVAVDLPHRCLEVSEARYEHVTALDGTDLSAADEWQRRSHFPKCTRDGRTVLLDFGFAWNEGDAGVRELSGALTCLCANERELVDVGFVQFAVGETGSFAAAELVRADVGCDDQVELEVRLQMAAARLLGARLVTDGVASPLEQVGLSACNDDCTVTWRGPGPLAVGAQLVLEVASDLQQHAFHFTLRDLDWVGCTR